MLDEARYSYNQNSLLACQLILMAQMGLAAISVVFHLAAWSAGYAGFFETPALHLTAQPIYFATIWPAVGWMAGFIAHHVWGDVMDEASPYQALGNVSGQLIGAFAVISLLGF